MNSISGAGKKNKKKAETQNAWTYMNMIQTVTKSQKC